MKPIAVIPHNQRCPNLYTQWSGVEGVSLHRCSLENLVGDEPCRMQDWLSCPLNNQVQALAKMIQEMGKT